MRTWIRTSFATLIAILSLLGSYGTIVAEISVIDTGLAEAVGMDFSDGQFWVAENLTPSVRILRFDPATGNLVGSIPSPVTTMSNARDIVIVGDYIFQPEDLNSNHHIHQFLKATGLNVAEFSHPANFPTGVASDGEFLFVVDNESRTIYKRQLPGLAIVDSFPIIDVSPPAGQNGLTYVEGHLYLARESTVAGQPSFVQKYDPTTGALLETLALPPSLVSIGGLMDLAFDGSVFWFLFRDDRIYRGPSGFAGLPAGCPDAEEVDYQGFSAADCAAPQNAVTVFDQDELDAYMADFAFDGSTVKNLNVKFNPTGDVIIVSPCEINLAGESGFLDIEADNVCVYGRKGVSVAQDQANPDLGIAAESILLVSEEGNAGFSQGLTLTANEIKVQALKEAKIGLGCFVTVAGQLSLVSTGDLSSSNAIIRQGSNVAAEEISLSASRSASLGKNTVVSVAGDLALTSTGTASKSVAAIKEAAQIDASSLRQVSGNKAKVGKNAVLDVAGDYELNADGSCSIAGTAVISAGSTSGNCFE